MERFKKIYEQGVVDVMEIWVDTETGVHYVFTGTEMQQALRPCWIRTASRL